MTTKKTRRPTAKQQALVDEQRVRHAYHRVASGVEVPVFSLTAIKRAGMDAVAAGADDAALDLAVRAAVDAAVGRASDVAAEMAGIRSIAHRL